MPPKTFEFRAPLPMTICQQRLETNLIYTTNPQPQPGDRQPSVIFKSQQYDAGMAFEIPVMLAVIKGTLTPMGSDTYVQGRVHYSWRWRLMGLGIIGLIFAIGLILTGAGLADAGTTLYGILLMILGVLGIPGLLYFEYEWLNAHEFDMVRMVKRALHQ